MATNNLSIVDGLLLFGEYPQSECTDINIVNQAWLAPCDSRGYMTINGKKYAVRSGKVFNVEPIRWKPLGRDGNKIIAVADKLLFAAAFANNGSSDYSRSDAKKLLEGEFANMAFGGLSEVEEIRLPKAEELTNGGLKAGAATDYALATGAYTIGANHLGYAWTTTVSGNNVAIQTYEAKFIYLVPTGNIYCMRPVVEVTIATQPIRYTSVK
jgi:hypothetical protein